MPTMGKLVVEVEREEREEPELVVVEEVEEVEEVVLQLLCNAYASMRRVIALGLWMHLVCFDYSAPVI